jgi:hypothetical protein
VAALVIGGLVALAISFLVPTTPETVTVINGRRFHSSNTELIDVALTFCRFFGALALVVGICAMFAYRRGEMDVPHEAVPPESHTMDDGLPPSPPPGLANGRYP